MKNIVFIFTIIVSLVFSGCGGGGGGSDETENTNTSYNENPTTTSNISGKAVDGEIKEATVCIDLNENNLCDTNEPSTKTDINGNYSFYVSNTIGTKPILVLGGIDTATNKVFDGILKETITIDSNDITSINITPLTTIATELYQDEKKTDINYTPNQAKSKIAQNLGLNVEDIVKNPLLDKTIFEKTQKIIQATKLLQAQIQQDSSNQTKNQNAFKHIIKQVALSIKEDTASNDFDTDNHFHKDFSKL